MLDEIYGYTFRRWGREQAKKYVADIYKEIRDIKKNNIILNKSKYGLSYIKYEKHFIFFKINEDKNEIYIHSILHEKMDIARHLKT